MLVCVSNNYGTYYPTTAKPNTAALASGFRQAGVLSDAPNVSIGREMTTVSTGIYGLPAEMLFKAISGTISFSMYGVDAGLLALGLGVDPVITADTETTTITADPTIDVTTNNTALTLTSGATFTVGQTVQVCATTDTAFSTNLAKILTINGTACVLDRQLRQDVDTGAKMTAVKSIMIPIGGAAPKYFSFAGLTDFPDGRVALLAFPKVYSAKPLTFSFGSGQSEVKVPVELQAVGVLDSTYGVLVGKIIIFP